MMQELACDAVPVPAGLASATAGYRWARNLVGEGGGTVHRLYGKAGSPDLYLKHGRGPCAGEIADEAARMRWLAPQLPVPAVRGLVRTVDAAWLLMTAMPGMTAHQRIAADSAVAPAIVDAVAGFLRRLHAIPAAGCPFDAGLAGRLVLAGARVEAGLVAEDDFDEERSGWTARRILDRLHADRPVPVDPVVAHGDFTFDNVLVDADRVVGCIDLGRVGIADRHQDLALAWNSLEPAGRALQSRFLRQYGLADVDRRRLAYYRALDELF